MCGFRFAGKVNEALAKGDQSSGLTKQQVVEALVTYHSEHGSTDDPCTLNGFIFARYYECRGYPGERKGCL